MAQNRAGCGAQLRSVGGQSDLSPWAAGAIILAVFVFCLLVPSPYSHNDYVGVVSSSDDGHNDPLEIASAVGAIVAAVCTGALALFALIQIRDSRRSNERQLRAYVSVSTGGVTGLAATTKVSAKIFIENVGQTPAYEATCYMAIQPVPMPMTKESDLSFLGETGLEQPKSTATLAPGHEHRLSFIWETFDPLPAEHIVGIRNGELALVVAGWIRYRDIFGQFHRANFCHLYWGADTSDGSGRYHRLGNDAD